MAHNWITSIEIHKLFVSLPKWANYAALDKSGRWFWFKHKPVANEDVGMWLTGKNAYHDVHDNDYESGQIPDKFTPRIRPQWLYSLVERIGHEEEE